MIRKAVAVVVVVCLAPLSALASEPLNLVEFVEATSRFSLTSEALGASGVDGVRARACWETLVDQDEAWGQIVALDARIKAIRAELDAVPDSGASPEAAEAQSADLIAQIGMIKSTLALSERAIFDTVTQGIPEQLRATLVTIYENRALHLPMSLRVVEWSDLQIRKYREQCTEQSRVMQLSDGNQVDVEVSFLESVWADLRVQNANASIMVRKTELAGIWNSVFQTLTF